MADFYGKGYVIDYCIAFFREKQKEEFFKIYVTDALKVIAENTANMMGGKAMSIRFYDMINPKEIEESAEDIIKRISEKIEMIGSDG